MIAYHKTFWVKTSTILIRGFPFFLNDQQMGETCQARAITEHNSITLQHVHKPKGTEVYRSGPSCAENILGVYMLFMWAKFNSNQSKNYGSSIHTTFLTCTNQSFVDNSILPNMVTTIIIPLQNSFLHS